MAEGEVIGVSAFAAVYFLLPIAIYLFMVLRPAPKGSKDNYALLEQREERDEEEEERKEPLKLQEIGNKGSLKEKVRPLQDERDQRGEDQEQEGREKEEKGEQGEQGEQGEKGEQGEQGEKPQMNKEPKDKEKEEKKEEEEKDKVKDSKAEENQDHPRKEREPFVPVFSEDVPLKNEERKEHLRILLSFENVVYAVKSKSSKGFKGAGSSKKILIDDVSGVIQVAFFSFSFIFVWECKSV